MPGYTLVDHPVGVTIEDVLLVEDVETRSEGGEDPSSYAFTKAVAFVLPGEQLVFEQDAWLSEDIAVHRGPGALKEITPPEDDIDEEDADRFRTVRSIVSLARLR